MPVLHRVPVHRQKGHTPIGHANLVRLITQAKRSHTKRSEKFTKIDYTGEKVTHQNGHTNLVRLITQAKRSHTSQIW